MTWGAAGHCSAASCLAQRCRSPRSPSPACGGSHNATSVTVDSAAPAITKAEFVRRANTICAKGNAKNKAAGAKLGTEPAEAQVVAFVKNTEVPAVQVQIEELKALGAPPGDEATVAKMPTSRSRP